MIHISSITNMTTKWEDDEGYNQIPQESPSMASILILTIVINSRQLYLEYLIYNCIGDFNKYIKAYLSIIQINEILLLKILKLMFKIMLWEVNIT